MADVRQKVNQCTDDLVTALSNLQSVSWVEHDECTPIWQKKNMAIWTFSASCIHDFSIHLICVNRFW